MKENFEDSPVRFEKLSLDAPEYLASRKEKKEEQATETAGTAFGDRALKYIDQLRKVYHNDPEKPAKDIHDIIERSRNALAKLLASAEADLSDPYGVYASAQFLFRGALNDKTFQDAWTRLLGGKPPLESGDGDELMERDVRGGTLPDELYERMLRIHAENFKKEQDKFAKRLPDLLAHVKTNLLRGIRGKRLPITRELVEARIAETTIRLQDTLEAQLKEAWGEYGLHAGRIYIAESVPRSYVPEVLTHEIFHALSGRTANIEHVMDNKDQKNPAYEGMFDGVVHQRAGVRFDPDPSLESVERFGWLDEAITERLTLQTEGLAKGTYVKERLLLDLLLSSGKYPIDFHFLMDAYFENYDPKNSEKVPAWKTMTFVITKSYEPGFLVELDNIVKTMGVDAAINYMKSMYPSRSEG